MHQQVLAAAFIDTCAADLGWSLDPTVPVGAPLAVLPLGGPAGSLDLQLLGASHRAVVRRPDSDPAAGDVALVETVACLAGASSVLPRSVPPRSLRRSSGLALGYSFSSTVSVTGPEAFAAAVEAVLAGLPEASLIGRFPGHPLALTALTAEADEAGFRWRSWHVYPRTTEIVETRSEVQVGEALWSSDRAEQVVGAGGGRGAGRARAAGPERLLVR